MRSITAAETDFADSVRVLALAACGLLVSVKADGRFPLPESLSENVFQLLLLPYTAALCAAVTGFLAADQIAAWARGCRPGRVAGGSRGRWPERVAGGSRGRWPERVAWWSLEQLPGHVVAARPVFWALAAGVVFELFALVILRSEARKFAAFGYTLPAIALLAVGAVAGAALVWASWPGAACGRRLLFAAGVSYLAGQAASIAYFPLHAGRSDMLPLIAAAGRRVLEGGAPYGLYALPHTLPLTYLPGTWLAFLPAVAVGLDPRVIQALTTLVAAWLVYRAAPPARRDLTGCLAGLFLLMPYLQYRHEIYLGPLWLTFALVLFFWARGREVAAALAIGVAAASSQFAWVMLPTLVAYRGYFAGRRRALRDLTLVMLSAGVVVAPFAIQTPGAFGQGVFGHWAQAVNVTTANLSYFVARAASIDGLRGVQALVWVLATGAAARRIARGANVFYGTAAVLGLFVLLNSIVWVYFFLTVLFLLLAGSAAGVPALPARHSQSTRSTR